MKRLSAALGGLVLVFSTLAGVEGCSTDAGAGPDCTNGTRDGDEIGVDCGGSCGTGCTGATCTTDAECASAKCNAGSCAAKAGKPCGVGVGGQCADGQSCELDADCTSGLCQDAKCSVPKSPDGTPIPPGPNDGKKNNGETDVDCGGANAPQCDDGKACDADTDCKTGWCHPEKKQCIAPRADDGVQNGTETDVDCGGQSGVKCAETKKCVVDGDCTGACRFDNTCVDAPSCKPKLGGATCGAGEVDKNGNPLPGHESCCRTLEVPGFTDAAKPGKKVYLDKYEITSGRIRAFIEMLAAKNAGNLKTWVAANQPAIWQADWNQWLATSSTTETISVPHKPTNGTETAPWFRNVGTNFTFNQQLFVYVHGHNCGNEAGSYGFPTYWYPKDVQMANGSLERANAFDGDGNVILAKDYLDVKSATCIPNYMLAAFCQWDGGQLATDEVLDFVTNAPASLGSNAGCGTRCATSGINISSDSGTVTAANYNYPYFDDAVTSEGTARIAPPGRVAADVVRINANDEPWMDLAGNVHEVALDVTGATFTGKFALKYRGIGYSSARAGGNTTTGNLTYPEYRAGYSGGRCMRYK